MKILIVGAGLTGAVVCRLLRCKYKNSIQIEIWDKAKGVGGRMSTSRSPADDECTADLGAQYITTNDLSILNNKDIYDCLFEHGLLEPFTAVTEGMLTRKNDVKNFVTPLGVNSVIKYLLHKENVVLTQHVDSVVIQDMKCLVHTSEGLNSSFDAVILTMPVPQILQMKGCVQDIVKGDKDLHNNLNAVTYSSRYALAYFYTCPINIDSKWDIKYISDDSIVRYISIDNKKRNRPDSATAVVIHSTTQFGKEKIECSLDDIQTELTQYVEKMFPTLPKPISIKCQKWRYSQVTKSYLGNPGCILLKRKPVLIAGGDGFTDSNFDGCIQAAKSVLNVFSNNIHEV